MIERLVLASGNPGKLREFRRLLEPLGIAVGGNGLVRCLSASGCSCTKMEPIAFCPISFTDAGLRMRALPSVPSLSSIRTNFA